MKIQQIVFFLICYKKEKGNRSKFIKLHVWEICLKVRASEDQQIFCVFGGGGAKPAGVAGGSHKICFHPKSYFFCKLKSLAKFYIPTITHSGRKVTGEE